MKEFNQGKQCAVFGYSIHYNPYRHKGTAQQFIEWERGWNNQSMTKEAYKWR